MSELQYARERKPVEKAAFTGSKVWAPLRGSRLGYILSEIRSDFGSRDPELKGLVDKALRGHTNASGLEGDVFTAIRDRLAVHAKTVVPAVPDVGPTAGVNTEHARRRDRAKEIVHAFNWHRMADVLQLDELVHDFVTGIAKDHIKDRALREAKRRFTFSGDWKRNPEAFEAAKSNTGHTVGAFWKALRNHVNSKMTGLGAKKTNYSDEMIDRSLRRLAIVEEQREDVEKTKTAYHKPFKSESGGTAYHWRDHLSWLPTSASSTRSLTGGPRVNPEQYARLYASVLPEKYGILGTIKSYLSPSGEQHPIVNGVRFRSHPDGKTYDSDNASAAFQEIDALKHALHSVGLIQPQQDGESKSAYESRVNRTVGTYLPAVRAAAHANVHGLGDWYYKTADKITRIPTGQTTNEIERAREQGERPYLPAASVGKFDLAAAITPLVRKVATDRGELTPRFLATNSVYPELPSDENEDVLDLASIPNDDPDMHRIPSNQKDTAAAEFLHKLDSEKHSNVKKPFGADRLPYEVVEDHHDDGHLDFDIPEFQGSSPALEEVEKFDPSAGMKALVAKAKVHLQKRVRKAKSGQRNDVNQFIANSLYEKKKAEEILSSIQSKFKVDPKTADKLYENFKKLKTKPEPTNRKASTQKKGPMKKRKFHREPSTKEESLVQYGRAPSEELKGFFQQSEQNNPYDQNNNSDHVFADFLGDHEDPRDEIVRRDLQYRQGDGKTDDVDNLFWAGINKHQRDLQDVPEKDRGVLKGFAGGYMTHLVHLEDGTVLELSKDRPGIYNVFWHHKDVRGHGSKGTGFAGLFLGHELNSLLDKLGVNEEKHEYGRAPADAVKEFFKKSEEADSYVGGGSHPDLFFQDYLDDHDDPRGEIVKRDFSYRSNGNSFLRGIALHRKDLLKTGPHPEYDRHTMNWTGDTLRLSDGSSISVEPDHQTEPGSGVYNVSWQHPKVYTEKGVKTSGYLGLFTGKELNELIPKILADESAKYGRATPQDIHSFFDTAQHENDMQPSETHPIFADLLGDSGDPREEIVRRDLSYRDHKSWSTGYHLHRESLQDEIKDLPESKRLDKEFDLKDGTKIKAQSNAFDGHNTVDLFWGPQVKGSGTGFRNVFQAVFTRAKATELLKKLLDEEHPQQFKRKSVKAVGSKIKKLLNSGYKHEQTVSLVNKYARIGDPRTYDALIGSAVETKDHTALGVLADHLEEHSQPGAKLARAGMEAGDNGLDPFGHNKWSYTNWNLPSPVYLNEEGKVTKTSDPVNLSEIEVAPYINQPGVTQNLVKAKLPPVTLVVTQAPSTIKPHVHLQYGVPVYSKEHLRELISDLPEVQGNTIWDLTSKHLPEKADKYSAYKAPVDTVVRGTVYKAGTFLPDPNKFAVNYEKTKKRKKKNRQKVKHIILKIFQTGEAQ
jgi:chromatin remodeling complex protein RSC6